MKFVHVIEYQTNACDDNIFVYPPIIATLIKYERHMIYEVAKDKKIHLIREYGIKNKQLYGYNSNEDIKFDKNRIKYNNIKELLLYHEINKLDTVVCGELVNNSYKDYGFCGLVFKFAFQYETDQYKNDNFEMHFQEFEKQLKLILMNYAEEARNKIKQIQAVLNKTIENNEIMLQHNWKSDCSMITK